jgi:tRNA (cmo5U34)-methyltransferase
MDPAHRTRRQKNPTGWDNWARIYPTLETLLLGSTLRRARALWPPPATSADGSEDWLLLGDGRGHGLRTLLNSGRARSVVSLDVSAEMLRRSRKTAQNQSRKQARNPARPHPAPRLEWIHADILHGWPPPLRGRTFHGVATAFFLDVFTPEELAEWWPRVADQIVPGGIWVVTDFTPPGALQGWASLRQRLLLSGLYPAFRWTTPMRARSLPDLLTPFAAAEWQVELHHRLPSGIAEQRVWRKPEAPAGARPSGNIPRIEVVET